MTGWTLSQWKKFRSTAPTATSSKNDVGASTIDAPNVSAIADEDQIPPEMQRLREEMPELYRNLPQRFVNQ